MFWSFNSSTNFLLDLNVMLNMLGFTDWVTTMNNQEFDKKIFAC